MLGEGCGLAVTETASTWICTGNDSSPENSTRLVRVCDASGAILGYRVTPMPILAIRMFKPDNVSEEDAKIVIVTHLSIFIYDAGLENCLSIIDTESNPNGAIAVSYQEPLKIAYPCPSVRGAKVSVFQGESTTVFPNTFSSNLQILEFSPSGTRLAATDQDGLAIYAVELPEFGQAGPQAPPPVIKSYRRGVQKCKMTSLSFNARNEDVMCCASDHGTIHVFNITPSSSFLSRVGSVLWNFQIKDSGEKNGSNHIIGSSWGKFSANGSRLLRVSNARAYVYDVDISEQKPGHTLLYDIPINPQLSLPPMAIRS